VQWLRRQTRRAVFSLRRSVWDAADTVGGHVVFRGLSALAGVILIFLLASDGLAPALYGIAAAGIVFGLFVLLKFFQALAHPDKHRHWGYLDYGDSGSDGTFRLQLQSRKTLQLGPITQRPLICRVRAPDKSLWESKGAPPGHGPALRMYPRDFENRNGEQVPLLRAGAYEVTWLEPRGPFLRPLLRYEHRVTEGQISDAT
jgi:hypothetical protein